jgi:cysteinyl-tRNA synthetase
LTFLGYEPAQDGGKPDLTVPVGPSTGEDFAYSEELHYLCLKTHPRSPLRFTREGLSAASADLQALRASVRALSGVSLEPSSRGVTGYLHRFREALSRDFDFPEAVSCVWDGLRPGALSPGSKAALLRAALPALGLDFPSADRP